MTFRNYATPHSHSAASLDTASTPEKFAAWELEHGTGALTVTDHGTLAGARRIYDLATGKKYKGKLTPILGMEAYVRDDNCPILKAHGIDQEPYYYNENRSKFYDQEEYEKLSPETRALQTQVMGYMHHHKYFHLTMHCLDQAAYEKLSVILSRAELTAEQHGSEWKPIFTWADIEELASQNITFGSGCLIGMTQRHIALASDNPRYDIAEAYYRRLHELAKPGNLYVEVFPHVCDRNWSSKVHITFTDGSKMEFRPYTSLQTDQNYGKRNGAIRAEDLYAKWMNNKEGHGRLLGIMSKRVLTPIPDPKTIADIQFVEGFIVNECTAFSPDSDLQAPANKFVMEMARKYGDKILISDDSHFTLPEEKIIQDVKLMQGGDWRFANSYHRQSSEESWQHFQKHGVEASEFETWIANSHEWVERFKGFKLEPRKSLPTRFYPTDTLGHMWALIQKHGRAGILKKPEYAQRLRAEINLLYNNGTIDLLPYFMIDEEITCRYTDAKELTGPGRGSAAGLLLAWLLELTHADPLRFDLSMDRFLTSDRIAQGKLPDIDQDLPHRDLLVDPQDPRRGWLKDRFGDCYARIGTELSMKAKSAVLDVHRILSTDSPKRVPDEVARLAHKFTDPPQGISNKEHVFGYDNNGEWVPGVLETGEDPALSSYVQLYPKEWAIVQQCLGIPRGRGKHACGWIISNDPISSFIPTMVANDGEIVTQPTAAQVESSGGLKMDFLVIGVLNDIQEAIKLIQERQGCKFDTDRIDIGGMHVPTIRAVPWKGGYVDIWDLPEDQPVFRDICEGETESVFQFGTPGAVKWLRHFNHVRLQDENGEIHKGLDSIESLAAFTALDRPGPLDAYVTDERSGEKHNMLVEFARRARGKDPIGSFPILQKLFPETYGVITYQEQVQKTFFEIGKTTAIEANNFRIHVSKKQMKEIQADKLLFMKGAVDALGAETAEQLWSMMVTFGQYGFNKSHAVCYVIIGYACAFLKHHYPIEWWTAVLRFAKKKEVEEKFWRHVGPLIDMPDISVSGDKYEIVNDRIRAPLNLLQGIGPAAHEEICQYRPIASLEDLFKKIEAHRIATGFQPEDEVKEGKVIKKKFKKGRTALHSGIINALIGGGALDSFFPKDLGIAEKMEMAINTEAPITGNVYKKAPRAGMPKKKVEPRYLSLNYWEQYQLKKFLLPAYCEDLNYKVVQARANLHIRPVGEGLYAYRPLGENEEEYILRPGGQIAAMHAPLDDDTPWQRGWRIKLGTCAYVISHEVKIYHQVKRMAIFATDIDGHRLEFIKWPDRDENDIPDFWKKDHTGEIVLFGLAKFAKDKSMALESMDVVAPALNMKEKEETNEEADQ